MFKHCIFAKAFAFQIMTTTKNKPWKKWLIAALVVLLSGVAAIWWIFTEKFDDTKKVKTDFTVEAVSFIKEFQQNLKTANEKYAEKILVVNGTVAQIETVDTTANVKMIDPVTGDYIIFAFQEQHLAEAKALREGQPVSIKGSCSSGVYSEILGVTNISFKRCAVNK
ncbi:MAG TPA: hypothetical protein DCQ97_01960 [Chitinophagaceae bacterium]|nr:hypothetical protein [Chitinophagaceae bacterium]